MDRLRSWWNQIIFLCRHDKLGNLRTSGDLWVWAWMMVCLFSVLGLMLAVIFGVVLGVLQ